MEYWQKIRENVGKDQIILTSAAGAIIQHNKILLVWNNAVQKWQIPGGLQDLNESIQLTVEREIDEELDLKLTAKELISVYSSPSWIRHLQNGDVIQPVMFFFRMVGNIGQITLQESEISKYQFFDFDNIPENILECCKQKVTDFLNYDGKTILR